MKPISTLTLALVLTATAAATQTTAQTTAQSTAGRDGAATVIRAEDQAMTCVQIADEAAGLSERMGGPPRGGLLGSIGNMAKAGAAMLIPGAGLAIAGADAVTQGGRDEAAAARAADENRWYYLNGLSAGRDCQGEGPRPVSATAPTIRPSALTPVASQTPTPLR